MLLVKTPRFHAPFLSRRELLPLLARLCGKKTIVSRLLLGEPLVDFEHCNRQTKKYNIIFEIPIYIPWFNPG